eukprot:942807-Rhodomonas_salina.1
MHARQRQRQETRQRDTHRLLLLLRLFLLFLLGHFFGLRLCLLLGGRRGLRGGGGRERRGKEVRSHFLSLPSFPLFSLSAKRHTLHTSCSSDFPTHPSCGVVQQSTVLRLRPRGARFAMLRSHMAAPSSQPSWGEEPSSLPETGSAKRSS